MYKTTKTPPSGLENDDAKCLVKNLICMEKGSLVVPQSDDLKTSTSEGESSGGREINTIIKNSAVARKKRLNDGWVVYLMSNDF